jgi:hypothetical protein
MFPFDAENPSALSSSANMDNNGGMGGMNGGGPSRRSTRWGEKALSSEQTQPQQLQQQQQPLNHVQHNMSPGFLREEFNGGRPFDQVSNPPPQSQLPYQDGHLEGGFADFPNSGSGYGFNSSRAMGAPSSWDGMGFNPPPYNDNLPESRPFHTELLEGSNPSLLGMKGKAGSGKTAKFASSKASVPCRFFNTRKGCQFGDKCEFGHFIGVSAPAPLVPAQQQQQQQQQGVPMGPGSRQPHFKGPLMGPGPGLGQGMGTGLGPADFGFNGGGVAPFVPAEDPQAKRRRLFGSGL